MKLPSQKRKRLFVGLIIVAGIAFLFGLLFVAILSKSNKELVSRTITNFMSGIKTGKLEYSTAIFQSIIQNFSFWMILFLIGMSIIGFPVIFLLFASHAFTMGFSMSSIFYVYHWKGIILSVIYILPQGINLCIYLVLSYYAILFSKHLFNLLFFKKEISFRRLMRRYVKIYSFFLVFLILSSFIEVFLVPKFLSFFL